MNRLHKYDYRLVEDILSSVVNCPICLSVYLRVKYGQFDSIVDLKFNPLWFNNEEDASTALFAIELLRKCDFLPTSVDKAANAKRSFKEAEDVCKTINTSWDDRRNACAPQLFVAARKISQVLSTFCPNEMVELSGWGPGVTLQLRGRNANAFNKFRHNGEATKPLWDLLSPLWTLMYPTWEVKPKIYEGNRVIQVPKNSKTNRTIAVEPSLNLYFQKGVGSMIRRRLRAFGIYLNDQSVNQRLAAEGSLSGDLTTVDFSAASDTISSALVLDLLPFNWYRVLDVLRSPRGYHDDSLIEYEKFSSMGNGFTFELESLIFWALAKACVPDDHPLRDKVSVYGDDVIIPTDCYSRFKELCDTVGFTVNEKKSFSFSYYRESCGKHYWNGADISPIYIRSTLSVDRFSTGERMKLHNRLIEYSLRRWGGILLFQGVIGLLRQTSSVKNKVPLGYGDTGLIHSWSESCPPFDRKKWLGWRGQLRFFIPRMEESEGWEVLLTRLSSFGSDRASGNSCPIPRVGKYRLKTFIFQSWPDYPTFS